MADFLMFGFDKRELSLYFGHIAQLFSPRHNAGHVETYTAGDQVIEPGSLDGWSDEDIQLIVEEGRRQMDRLGADFERLRERGKYVFTIGLALVTAVAGLTPRLRGRNVAVFIPWYFGVIVLVIGFLGAAAVFVVTARLGSIDTVLLSRMNPPTENIARDLAKAYPKAVKDSANAVNNRFTILRDAVWFTIVGAVIELGVWFVLYWPN